MAEPDHHNAAVLPPFACASALRRPTPQ